MSAKKSLDVFKKWETLFQSKKVTDPWYSVKWLAQHVNKDAMCPGFKFSPLELQTFENLCNRRLKHEPIQYIIGEWTFCGFDFKIREPTLIFRPETEHFVDIVTNYYKNKFDSMNHELRLMEIGCGSGVITATLLNRFINATAIAIDCQLHAIEMTNINCKLINVADRVEIIHCDIANYKDDSILDSLDFIISNPPYVFTHEMEDLSPDIINYECLYALNGGSDGLNVINNIANICPKYLKQDGLLWLECHHSHCQTFRNHSNLFKDISLKETYFDFHDVERFACFEKVD